MQLTVNLGENSYPIYLKTVSSRTPAPISLRYFRQKNMIISDDRVFRCMGRK